MGRAPSEDPPAGKRSPFVRLRPVAVAACGYAVAAVVWIAFGDTLPGGRWFAVHLFTLGILTNLVVALSEHFAITLLRVDPPARRTERFVLLNVGALVLLGFPPSLRYPLAGGALALIAAVTWLALDLRRMRRDKPDARFAFVVASYERACVAFLAGAVLGALLGIGVLPGAWYGAARLAHLHLNILGWGGLTLLATLVFFGPTMMRTRMRPSADATAARALPVAAGGLGLAAVGLLLTGAVPFGTVWPRLVGGAGLAVYAAAATLVCVAVLRAGRSARPALHAHMIRAACVWFVVVVWADALAIGTWWLRVLDPLGAVLIVGVLGQAILATLNYLTPMVWVAGPAGREDSRGRLEVLARTRTAAFNVGVALVGVAGVLGRDAGLTGTVLSRSGWVLIATVVLAQIALIARDAGGSLRRA